MLLELAFNYEYAEKKSLLCVGNVFFRGQRVFAEIRPLLDLVLLLRKQLSDVREEILNVPEEISDIQNLLANIPEEVLHVPELLGNIPEEVLYVPGQFWNVPEELLDVQNLMANIPEEVLYVPEQLLHLPKLIGNVRKELGKIRKLQLFLELAKRLQAMFLRQEYIA
jgi:hypothetical protein